MVMSATTARRSDMHSSKLQTDLASQQSPLRSTNHQSSRTSTPRPSISPLSTASKADPSSPTATRSANMPATSGKGSRRANNSENGAGAEAGLNSGDESSSLSEPDDDDEEMDGDERTANGLDDESELPAPNSLDVDSEAETERLDQTPQKLRKHGDAVGRTPSKLKQAAGADDELSEAPSPVAAAGGAASSTSTNGTTGQKRKRSEPDDSPLTSAESDLEESPRKRNHKSPEPREDEDEENTAGADDLTDDTPAQDEAEYTPVPRAKGGPRGRKGKRKGGRQKEPVEETEAEAEAEPEAAPAAEEEVEAPEPEEEVSEEAAAKTEEDLKAQAEAAQHFEDLAKQFNVFREALYNERLESMTADLKLLEEPNSIHPEYLRQVAALDARRDKQVREAHAFYRYRTQCLQERAIGERSQLHSQYMQTVRDLREEVLYNLGEDWYNIQKERRQNHQAKDDPFIFKFPTKKSMQVRQQAKYNQEVSVLSGVAKHVGFPAAPDINGPMGHDLDDDLKAMKITKRVPHSTAHVAPAYLPVVSATAKTEQLAHQQFIEQNAWARPQPSFHNHGTPGLTHTPDWAEPGPRNSARSIIRNLSGHVHPSAPPATYASPTGQTHTLGPENSDVPEPPSSLQAAPPTSDRMHNVQQGSSRPGSPLHVHKQRQEGGPELTGFRNISNVSGTSTIDAPTEQSEREREMERERQGQYSLPTNPLAALTNESATRPPSVFDASQINRFAEERREAYPTAGFRPS